MPGNKKEAILAIAKILFEHTDRDHPMKQNEVAQKLLDEYEIVMERKAISSSYLRLEEVGFHIVSGSRGAYLDRENSTYLACGFSNAELRLLIDSIRCNRYLSVKHSKKLIEKLEHLSNEYFAHSQKNISFLGDWDKSENVEVFERVQTLAKAIQLGNQVKIQYGKYRSDLVLRESSYIMWSPYLLLWHNQRYYLMARNEKYGEVQFIRVDQMLKAELTDIPVAPLRDQPKYKDGLTKEFLEGLAVARPYMFSDKPSNVTFTIPKSRIGDVVDWFGKKIRMENVPQGSVSYAIKDKNGNDMELVRIRVTTSVDAMKYWALQYLDSVTIEYPDSLKEAVKQSITTGAERYSK